MCSFVNCHFRSCWTQAECDLFQISFQCQVLKIRFRETGGEIVSFLVRGEKRQQKRIKNYL